MEPEPANTEETLDVATNTPQLDNESVIGFNYSTTNTPIDRLFINGQEVVTGDFDVPRDPDEQPQTDEQKLEANCGNLNVLD